MTFLKVYLYVGAGGVIGSLLRFIISLLTLQAWGNIFPFGTLTVNLIGSFALGWFTKRLVLTRAISPHLSSAIGTGLIGSFTTFSTLSTEFLKLMQSGDYYTLTLYAVISVIGGLIFASFGSRFGEYRKDGEEE
jgi:CrcB protein